MSLFNLLAHFHLHLAHVPGSMLYLTQSATYGMAYWAVRKGKHAPAHVYLASSLVHLTMAMLFCSPLD